MESTQHPICEQSSAPLKTTQRASLQANPKTDTNSTCWCSAGNEGMTLINHPLWFPLRKTKAWVHSISHSLRIAPASQKEQHGACVCACVFFDPDRWPKRWLRRRKQCGPRRRKPFWWLLRMGYLLGKARCNALPLLCCVTCFFAI